MSELHILPSVKEMKMMSGLGAEHWRPCLIPHAVVLEGALSKEDCDHHIQFGLEQEVYTFPGCKTKTTRELPYPLPSVHFFPIRYAIQEVNTVWWKFDIDPEPQIWMQTYNPGDSYGIHMDGSPGQSRKLTAIVMLSDPSEYEGGQLRLVPYPKAYNIPKTRGTIAIFPSWILHDVSEVTKGIRHTLNVGYWGPPFK